MYLGEELSLLYNNLKKYSKELYEKAKLHPLISLIFIFAVSLVAIPHYQVSGLNNTTEKVKIENQDRTTLAQIFGDAATGVELYYTWQRIPIYQEGRFTLLGNILILSFRTYNKYLFI